MGALSKGKVIGLLAGLSIYVSAVQPAAAASFTFTATGSGSDGPLAASAELPSIPARSR